MLTQRNAVHEFLFYWCLDEDETAGLLEDACTPIDQVLKKLTNGEVTGPIKPKGRRNICVLN